jgi:hypothetical protein
MQLITSNTGLRYHFSNLLRDHAHVSVVVAWASTNFMCCDQLMRADGKIKRMIVGLHFCQTAPEFIEHFITDKRVKFLKQGRGVFYPKVYFFEKSSNEWACIIGAPISLPVHSAITRKLPYS